MNIYIKNSAAKDLGFTIVETLVAITIIMIAIAGPLVVASRGLFGANFSKNQMIASYLAQESMEVVKNKKDNNVYDSALMLTGLSGCTSANLCDASALGSGTSPSIVTCPPTFCPIYASATGYDNTSSASPLSPFRRAFYIHTPGGTSNCASSEDCQVTVKVAWTDAGVDHVVLLTSEITNSIR